MSFSEPAKVITQLPRDFDMKRITRKRPLQQRKLAKAQSAKATEPSSFEPPCEQQTGVWKVVTFISALAVVFAALITGIWER